MSQYSKIKIIKLTGDEESFASEIETNEIELDNFQSVKIVVNSGADIQQSYTDPTGEPSGAGGGDPIENEGASGTEEATTVRIIAILDDETEQEIKSEEIFVGNATVSTVDVVANEIAHYETKRIKVKVDAIEGSQNTGSVFAVLSEARYSE